MRALSSNNAYSEQHLAERCAKAEMELDHTRGALKITMSCLVNREKERDALQIEVDRLRGELLALLEKAATY